MTLPPRKETISSRVLAEMRGAILRADLAPGAKINLDHLRHRFDTSISPLREALARLTADGLVVFEDQRGFRVAPVSRVELDDLYALRADLEVVALQDAMLRGGMDWESGVIRALHRLHRTSATNSPDDWQTAHRALHHALIAGATRPLLLQTCAGLADLCRRYRALAGLAGDGEDGPDSHDAIATATAARDGDTAAQSLRRHLQAEHSAIARHFPLGQAASAPVPNR
jgi:GntR family carbon starvation induced transcriptional regulator